MRARQVLFGVCLASCLAIACGDDDDDVSPPGKSGSAGSAGKAGSGNAGTPGKGGNSATAGTSGKGGSENMAGMPGEPMGGAGGMGPDPSLGFVDFVHDLIENETAEDNPPSSVLDQQFSEPTDDHGHYVAPADAFDDLF